MKQPINLKWPYSVLYRIASLSLYIYIAGTAHLYQRDRQPYIMQTKTDTHQQALGWSQCLHSAIAGEPTSLLPPSSQD